MILFVCAVAQELAWLAPRPDVEVLVTGVGPVEAAIRVTQALATRTYGVVVNAGIAGALPGAARIGDGVLVTEERFEVNLESGAAIALPDGARTRESVTPSQTFLQSVRLAEFQRVRGMTVARVTTSDATAARLRALGAEVESMEGFAVLRAAESLGVSALEVRGISNYVGDRARSGWDFAAGIAGLQRITQALLAEMASRV